jgi:copper(I)-binding protein
MAIALGAALLGAGALAQPQQGVSVRDGQIRANAPGAPNSAAYMVVYNASAHDDQLLSVSCPCAGQASLHVSHMVKGVMHMQAAGAVTIPAHGRVAFTPGGLHVMLTDLKSPLTDGQSQTLSLHFAHAGRIDAPFAVRNHILAEDMAPMQSPMVGMKP